MTGNKMTPPVESTVRLGVRGLVNLTDSMTTGGLYVLIAKVPSARFPILASSIADALMNDQHCTVIVPAEPKLFVQKIKILGQVDTETLMAANRLNVFVMQEEFSKKVFRFGADRFVSELEQLGIPENSYLVFDRADELLTLHDITQSLEQVDVLRKWFDQHRVTALLVFSRATEVHLETINALMDSLTGIVQLGGGRDGLELTFDYWQSADGSVAARSYKLQTLDSGLYEATTRLSTLASSDAENRFDSRQDAEEPEVTEDAQPQFFYMDPDLESLAEQMPGSWQRADTLVGIMHATRNTRSATSILCFQRDSSLRQLAEAVHTLRLALGRSALIVVQEKGTSLRYQNEALLLHLGLNLVIHRDVPISRLPLLLESLRGQIFNRDVNVDFEMALASVLPTGLRGYQLPSRFVREVGNLLARAETLNIPCAMVIGKPSYHHAIIDILKNDNKSRPGDLISSDGQLWYLFLNACPQSSTLTALERMLGMSVDMVFDEIGFLVRREEIQAELQLLLNTAENNTIPDFTSLIGAPPESPPSRTITTIDEPPDTVDTTTSNAPDTNVATKVRRPLKKADTTRGASASAQNVSVSPAPPETAPAASSDTQKTLKQIKPKPLATKIHRPEALTVAVESSTETEQAGYGKQKTTRAKRSTPATNQDASPTNEPVCSTDA